MFCFLKKDIKNVISLSFRKGEREMGGRPQSIVQVKWNNDSKRALESKDAL